MGDLQTKRVVAYVPFKTFLSAIEALERGIPHQIDSSVWPTYSGAIQSQLLAAFRFLGLLGDSGKPTTALKNLVEDKANRKAALRRILESSYAKIVSLGLTKVSPRQFEDAIREYGMSGETHKKVVSFFLQAAKYAELPVSPLLGRKTRVVGRRRRTAEVPANGAASVSAVAMPTNEPQGTSKTVRLQSGGSLTLTVEGSFLEMTADDRLLVFALIDKLRDYEKHKAN